MQNKVLFSPQSILVYDPMAGTCTIWTSEPSSDTGPASCLTDQERAHILEAQRDPEDKTASTLFFSTQYISSIYLAGKEVVIKNDNLMYFM